VAKDLMVIIHVFSVLPDVLIAFVLAGNPIPSKAPL